MYIFKGIYGDRGLICFCRKLEKIIQNTSESNSTETNNTKMLHLRSLFTVSAVYLKFL